MKIPPNHNSYRYYPDSPRFRSSEELKAEVQLTLNNNVNVDVSVDLKPLADLLRDQHKGCGLYTKFGRPWHAVTLPVWSLLA